MSILDEVIKELNESKQQEQIITYADNDDDETNKPNLTKKKVSKSIDDFNERIAFYEIMVEIVKTKLSKILKFGFSEQLLKDFEYIITTQTLLKLNIIPRNIKHVKKLYLRYKDIYNKP